MANSEYNYIPMYIRRTINNRPKDVVTAKYWNELFNLLIAQGDHTAEAVANVRGAFRINVTSSNGVYTADKTFDEIKAAYDAGQLPYVVLTGGTFDLVYTLANFDAPTDGSEPKFVDFKRYLVGDGILETDMLRIYSYTTDSGSNVEKRIDAFKMPTSLKNPNALTFTGGATGSYDGSEPETVHIPVIPYEVINKNTAARHSHDNKTVLDSITADDVAKLAQEPLYGTTLTLTPTQVYDAVSVGIPVEVQYFDGTYGGLSFTVFNVVSQNMIVSQRIVYEKGEYILAELRGNKPNGTWSFVTTTLAEKTDIPSLEGYATEAYVQNYHDNTKQDIITDLATIRSGASKGATAVQPEAGKGLFSGSYNDLTDKPAIPDTVTEGTVSGWGFTKNTGTYSKPAGGIPKSDLAAAVQTSLGKADTALQEHQSLAAYRTAAAQDAIDSGKVDKVTGKGLSSNDYTAAAKAKVDAIPANPKYTDTVYDDTALKERVATIEGKESAWDAKSDFSGSYNDLTDKPTIPDISGKQDKLIAGEGITIAADGKTISSSGATVFQTKSITDSGGHFTSDTVEGALQEIGAELAGLNTLLGSGIQISFTIDIGEPKDTFSAVSGETWKEWIGGYSRVISEISGLTLYCFSDDGIIFADEAGVNALGLNDVWVHGNETIVSGATYAIIPCGG